MCPTLRFVMCVGCLFFFLVLFVDKRKEEVLSLWSLGKVLCVALQKCVRTTAQRTLKVK